MLYWQPLVTCNGYLRENRIKSIKLAADELNTLKLPTKLPKPKHPENATVDQRKICRF